MANSVGHDGLVLALGARETTIGIGTFEAVNRTGATVTLVQNVIFEACPASHHVLAQGDAIFTVERAL